MGEFGQKTKTIKKINQKKYIEWKDTNKQIIL